MSLSPLVSVIVVTYNSREHLAECLDSLCSMSPTPTHEIIVWDNASGDDSAAIATAFAARHPQVRAYRGDINRGYAGGVNAALAQARGHYIAVLNPDMMVTAEWLAPLVAFLESHSGAGAVNPLVVLRADETRVNAAGQSVHVTGLGFNRGLGQPRARFTQPARVSGLQGGAFLIRRALLEQMGGWDESGFMYHEDVDLSWLLQLMGDDLYCEPESVVSHAYHLSMYPEKLFLLERNRWAMLVTHLEPLTLFLLTPFLLMTEAMLWGYCLLRGPAFLRAKAASYRWVLQQQALLAGRRTLVRSLRKRSDGQILRGLAWGYAWDQFLTLGRERGPSRRQPAGGMPVELSGPP
jgi:hypothetical protein